ncbi:apoptosis facilitator Bcl-2-like protein 14 [Ctenodactylus gundi]
MCSTSTCDLEDIPLEDDDPAGIELKILEFYLQHHVFSPKVLRTRSLSQQGLGSQSPTLECQAGTTSPSSKKRVNLGKRWFFSRASPGGTEREDQQQGSPWETRSRASRPVEYSGFSLSQPWSRSLSNVTQRLEDEAVDPKVASIANRVAEIVHSWPPPEETQRRHFKFTSTPVAQGLPVRLEGLKCKAESSETDGEDQVIAKIVELLKYSGDQLERELKKDKDLMSSFQGGLSYSVFKTIADQFLRGVDVRGESEVKAQGFKAALTIDATAKLTAIDNHPMNKVLGFGAKYLKENFSPWVQQHGGWEKVLGIPHEVD